MPAAIDSTARPTKRKRVDSEKRPVKRARSESSDEDAQAHILLLENEVFESKKHYNNIATLIKLVRVDDDGGDDAVVAAISLCRIFTRMMAAGQLTRTKDTKEKDLVVIQWLRERYAEYKRTLLSLLANTGTASTALTLCMRLLKTEGTHLRNGQDYCFPAPLLTDMVETLIQEGSDDDVRKEFSEKYVEEYDDVRFYTFEAIAYVHGYRTSKSRN